MGDTIDFEVLKETWCKYQVSDGTKIKMREVLLDVRRAMADGLPRYSINTDTQTAIMCDHRLRGEPTDRAQTREELARAIEQPDMRYDTISADHNIYILDDGTKIMINLSLVRVSRTTLCDRVGDRVYLLDRAPLVHATLAPQYEAQPILAAHGLR